MKKTATTAFTEVYTLIRVAFDRRTPRRATAVVTLTVVYVLVPIDLFSDVIPVVGWSDNLFLSVIARHGVYKLVPESVVEEHRTAARSHMLVAVVVTLAVGVAIAFVVLRAIGVV